MGPEKKILQREVKSGVPSWLWNAACLVVLACSLALIAAISWGVGRFSRRGAGEPLTAPAVPSPEPVPTGSR